MTVTLELSLDDARLLRDHLLRHIAEVDDELVHTERRQLRHEIALDVDRLRQIESRLARLVEPATLQPLDDRPGPEPAAAAHRDQAVAAAGALELVQRGGDEPRAGAAGRMAERDRAAVRVHALRVRLQLLLPRQHDRREGLVHLGDVHVVRS